MELELRKQNDIIRCQVITSQLEWELRDRRVQAVEMRVIFTRWIRPIALITQQHGIVTQLVQQADRQASLLGAATRRLKSGIGVQDVHSRIQCNTDNLPLELNPDNPPRSENNSHHGRVGS